MGTPRPLPLTATTADELELLSVALHDWWIADPQQRGDHQLVLQLEAEGVACGPHDDWQTYTISRSGAQHWEAPPASYGSELVFRDVTDGSLDDTAAAGNYTIIEMAFDDGMLTLRAEPKFVLTLQLGSIDVIARDRE